MNDPLSPAGEPVAAGERPQKPPGLARLRRIVAGAGEGSASRDARALAELLGERTGAEVVLTPADAGGSLKEIAAEKADLIVVVSGGALDDSPCAIAIAPAGLAGAKPKLETIAVGYEGGKEAGVALELAIELAECAGTSLLILGAVAVAVDADGADPTALEATEAARIGRHLARARRQVPTAVAVETRLLRGAPERALAAAAAGSDLLLLGSRGHYGPARRLLLGGVAARIVSDAPCAVLITPSSYQRDSPSP